MDIAIVEQATGIVISRVLVESLSDYNPGPGLIAIDVSGGQIAYSGCLWTEQGGFVEPHMPPIDPVEQKANLVAYAADKRWRVETGGITVGGTLIDTSRESQSMITGAYVYSQKNPSKPVRFKAASGWVILDAATMEAIATAVGDHVQACFEMEGDLAADIEAGTITTVDGVDAADWPA